jgi:hypothetical protein
MNNLSRLTQALFAAASMLVCGSLSGCAGGGGAGGGGPSAGGARNGGARDGGGTTDDWYYHWNCNGDPECVALTEPGQGGLDGPSGTHNEGPVYANCSVLLTFARINWNIPPATNSCDHSPTGGGTSGTGGSGGGGRGGTTSTGGTVGSGGTTSPGGAVGSGGTTGTGGAVGSGGTTGTGGTTSAGGAVGSGGTTAVCVVSACPPCGLAGALCGGGDLRCCTPQDQCGCCTSSLGQLRCE